MSDCPNLSSYFTFDEKIMTFSLNEIRLWEKEKCYKMKDQILPKLAAIFNDEQCLTKKIFILHTMTEKFLEGFNSEEEMTKHYEPLLPEVFNVIEDCVRHLNVMKKFISNLRQNKNHGLEFYMNNLEENLEVVSLLLTSVTKICSACERHSLLFISWGLRCVAKFHELNEGIKDPELLGKGIKAIELLEQILTKLLQKNLLWMDLHANPKQLFVFYLSIQCAYRAVNWQNEEYHALLWKLYVNMVIQFDVLKQHFDSSKESHLRYLCIYILPFLQRITHYIETKMDNFFANSFNHDVHMCCCYLRIITFICRKFYEFEDECIEILYNLLSKFYYFLFCCTLKYLPTINYQFRNNVAEHVAALMLCLLGERKFLSLLFQPVRKELQPEVKVSYWVFKLSAVQLLPFSKGTSFGNVKCSCHIPFNIISDIMDDLYICDTELLLAYVNMVPYENPFRNVTLYEYINIVLCSSASKCCPRHFNDIERLMLKILLRRTDVVSCLICDIWYFFCRCNSQELVIKYCYLFEKLIQNTPRDSLLWIKYLTKRMIKLTPQLQLSDICPVLDAEIVNEDQTVLKFHTIHLVPHVIDMKLPSFFASFRRLKRLEQIISSQQNDSTFTEDLQIETVACLLDLSTYVVAFCKADPKTLLQVLYFATIMWNSKNDLIQIGILSVLQAFGHAVQPLGSYQNKVCHYLGKLFSLALDHDNYIIQHQALCVFYNFAHLTPHKEVVKNCMRSSCNQSMIEQFLKRVKNKTLLSKKRILETVLRQGKWLRENKNTIPKNVESDILSVVDSQQAMDIEEIGELHVTLKRMKDAAEKLASFKRLPSWALQSIKHTCQFMDKIDN